MYSFTFCLDTKSKQKSQGYARFAQKTGVHRLKSPKLVLSYRRELQTRAIFASLHLFFGSQDKAAPICMSKTCKNRTALFFTIIGKTRPKGTNKNTKPTESCFLFLL
jgi:hypothetical protein